MHPELSPNYFFDLTHFAHAALFHNCEYVWEALDQLKSYLASQQLGRIEVEIPSSAYLENPHLISIGKGTLIEPGAYIKGPCIIGENCQIRHGAYIRGELITGNGCVIGHTTEAKQTIMLDHAAAGHFAYLGNSILGNHANLGAGTKCANLKLDNKSVTIFFQGEKIETGMRKLGAVIGDYAQLGCNSVTNPGTLLGPYSRCYPCVNFGGWIASHQIVKREAIPEIISQS